MSKDVRHLYVRLSNDRIECSCPCQEHKLCVDRLKNDYECIEAMVRVSPVERSREISQIPVHVKSIDKHLRSVNDTLRATHKHIGGIIGKV